MKKSASKPVRNRDDQFSKRIGDLSKQARDLGFSDLDYLDQIPDNETMDEPIPFPYGGRGKFNTWKLK